MLLAVFDIFSAETERLAVVLMGSAIHGLFGQVGGVRSGKRVRLVLITEHTSKNSTVHFPDACKYAQTIMY